MHIPRSFPSHREAGIPLAPSNPHTPSAPRPAKGADFLAQRAVRVTNTAERPSPQPQESSLRQNIHPAQTRKTLFEAALTEWNLSPQEQTYTNALLERDRASTAYITARDTWYKQYATEAFESLTKERTSFEARINALASWESRLPFENLALVKEMPPIIQEDAPGAAQLEIWFRHAHAKPTAELKHEAATAQFFTLCEARDHLRKEARALERQFHAAFAHDAALNEAYQRVLGAERRIVASATALSSTTFALLHERLDIATLANTLGRRRADILAHPETLKEHLREAKTLSMPRTPKDVVDTFLNTLRNPDSSPQWVTTFLHATLLRLQDTRTTEDELNSLEDALGIATKRLVAITPDLAEKRLRFDNVFRPIPPSLDNPLMQADEASLFTVPPSRIPERFTRELERQAVALVLEETNALIGILDAQNDERATRIANELRKRYMLVKS
jgi:hypothetical protein